MTDITWITDRRPTAADADSDGDVRLHDPAGYGEVYAYWEYVAEGAPWTHTEEWAPQDAQALVIDQPSEEPRRFVSISRTALTVNQHVIDAIDDEGIAWWMKPGMTEWQRLTPLPTREVPEF